jgi:hypothetical protein
MLEKALPHWMSRLDSGEVADVYLVVEPQEYKQHRAWLREQEWDDWFNIHKLRSDNRGVNYARGSIVSKGNRLGLDRLIMADDDLFPSKQANVRRLDKVAARKDVVGVGACCSYYGLFIGNDFIKENNNAVLVPGGWGYRMFCIDVAAVLELGNYDVKLRSFWGDNDIARCSMSQMGIPWYMHCGVWYSSTAPRYAPGGIQDLYGDSKHRRMFMEGEIHGYLNKKWGDRYINKPPKRPLCRWKRFLGDYVKNWESKAPWLKEKAK